MAHRRLAGCVPICLDRCGSLEHDAQVLLISSRSKPQILVFPKGGVKKDESPEEAAIRESWEEAGIRGTILTRLYRPSTTSTDEYDNDRVFRFDTETSANDEIHKNSATANEHCRWFVLVVVREDDEYPEKGQRTKHWMKVSDALKLENIRENTRELLVKLSEFLESRTHRLC